MEKIPFYTGESVGDIFEDIVDAHLRAPLWIKKYPKYTVKTVITVEKR